MAPGADIVYVGAPNNYRDLDAIMNRVVDRHLADIVTNSYGYAGEALPPGYIKPQEDTYIQAAAEGISLFFSSGDDGDETGGDPTATPTPDWPASSPWVTAVGGTSMGVTAANTRLFELGWETGTSTWDAASCHVGPAVLPVRRRRRHQPALRPAVVPGRRRAGRHRDLRRPAAPGRVVPDVSALGDPNTGMLVGQTQRFSDGTYYDEYRIGGTSLSSPLYAGMFALAVQHHGSYGLANPALYAARGVSYDVTKNDRPPYPGAIRVNFNNGEDASGGYSYITRTFDWDEPLTIHVRPGYDDVTGVGSPGGPPGWPRSPDTAADDRTTPPPGPAARPAWRARAVLRLRTRSPFRVRRTGYRSVRLSLGRGAHVRCCGQQFWPAARAPASRQEPSLKSPPAGRPRSAPASPSPSASSLPRPRHGTPRPRSVRRVHRVAPPLDPRAPPRTGRRVRDAVAARVRPRHPPGRRGRRPPDRPGGLQLRPDRPRRLRRPDPRRAHPRPARGPLDSGALDFPTYDALFFGTTGDPAYALPTDYRLAADQHLPRRPEVLGRQVQRHPADGDARRRRAAGPGPADPAAHRRLRADARAGRAVRRGTWCSWSPPSPRCRAATTRSSRSTRSRSPARATRTRWSPRCRTS